jgi:hypothetical protein
MPFPENKCEVPETRPSVHKVPVLVTGTFTGTLCTEPNQVHTTLYWYRPGLYNHWRVCTDKYLIHTGMYWNKPVTYNSWKVCTDINTVHTSMYLNKPGSYNSCKVCIDINSVHTGMYRDKPGMYWYPRVCTREKKMRNDRTRTDDLVHSILHALPLRH